MAPRYRARWRIGPVVVALITFAALAAVTWRSSGRFLVDFGRELYVPWQISQGAVLYSDIDSLMGPAAAYLNGLIFWLAGPSVGVLLLANLAVLLITTLLIAVYFRDAIGDGALTVTLLTFLVLAFLSQVVGYGIFSFITPYSHEATHGFLYSIGALAAVVRLRRSGSVGYAVLTGTLIGAVFLTKPELFLAVVAGSVVAVVYPFDGRQEGSRSSHLRLSLYVILLASSLLLPLVTLAVFMRSMAIRDAMMSVAGAWRHVGRVVATRSPHYLSASGLDAPHQNLVTMVLFTGVALAGLWVAYVAGRRWGGKVEHSRISRLMVMCLCAGVVLSGLILQFPWLTFVRAIPLLVLIALVLVIRRALADEDSAVVRNRWLPLIVWGVFAIALLPKTVLAVRLYRQGFYLALPAMLFLVAVGVDVLPSTVRSRQGKGAAFIVRICALTLVISPVAYHGAVSYGTIAERTYEVGRGSDMILHDAPPDSYHGAAIDSLLVRLRRVVPDSATLAVLPEGAGINYLLRRPNSTPHISLIAPELAAFGEERILRDYERSPPSYILTWPRPLDEYAFGFFGRDTTYASRILDWIERSYTPVFRIDFHEDQEWLDFTLHELRADD